MAVVAVGSVRERGTRKAKTDSTDRSGSVQERKMLGKHLYTLMLGLEKRRYKAAGDFKTK